ncbi:MAG: DNA repair protein RecO [Anaerolineae bacterium]|nr:MAG: DNA repair protein RecO [Anaerolineae bacterium]
MKTFRSFRVEAVVLNHRDFGEADRLLTLYTRQRGKVRAIAKGVRKITSRRAGHLEPFTQVALQLAQGRDLFIITQAETIEPYLPLRDDLVRMGHAAYVVELVDRFTHEDEEAGAATLFHLLTATLSRLASRADPWPALRYFEIRLLDGVGFRPRLFECVRCEEPVRPEDQFFSFGEGGVVCARCGRGDPALQAASMEALKYLRHFQRSEYADAARARPTAGVRAEVERLIQGYLTYLLERTLNAPGFLRKIRGSLSGEEGEDVTGGSVTPP